jgi:NADH:ubiquinone reductase (H+-translocating)
MRIVVLGGGFGGVATVRHLERVLRRRKDVEITLVSRENFFVLTPLLFEACSGRLELRHCAQPIRAALQRARFIEATVESVDLDRQLVRAVAPDGGAYDLPYDHLVVALGASTNDGLIPGSSNALTFKTMADALVLRNHLIECFERADASADAAQRRECLTVAVIGGGLVGVELVGELTAFADDVLRFYPRIGRDEVCFRLFEAGPRILPEIDAKLAATAARVLERRGVDIQVSTAVRSIETERVRLEQETIDAGTIVLTAGIVPSAVASAIPVVRDQRGRIAVDATMRSRSHPQVWALGDCASIPGPDGRPYPALAQHAVREARHLASNIRAALTGGLPRRSCSDPSAPWRRSGIRAPSRAWSACDSRASSPGGYGGPITCFRCRAGIGGCALCSTGPSQSSSGRTSRGLICAGTRAGEAGAPVGGEVLGDSPGNAHLTCAGGQRSL